VFIPDLSNKTYYGEIRRDHLEFARLYPDVVTRSIGWLGAETPRTGDVPPDVLEALEHYTRFNRVADFFLGQHTCEICHTATSNEELWIVWKGVRYVVPVMVLHYIREHHYRPPDEFLRDLREKWAAGRDDPPPFEFDREWQTRIAHAGAPPAR
jgi:hypothetical protein